jgi:hypothetical protein
MISVTTEIFRDKSLKDMYLMNPKHEIQITEDLKKARVINPYGGAWGMAKNSGLNNLNRVVTVSGGNEEDYTVYSLRAMGQKVYFKILNKELKN